MPKYRPPPPEQPKGVQDDEEKSFDWGDVSEDSSDREQAGGLQALLAASPESLTDDAIDYTASADPAGKCAKDPARRHVSFFVGPSMARSRLRRQQWIAEKLGQESDCDLPVHAEVQPLAKDPWTALQQHPAPHLCRPPVHRLTGQARKSSPETVASAHQMPRLWAPCTVARRLGVLALPCTRIN